MCLAYNDSLIGEWEASDAPLLLNHSDFRIGSGERLGHGSIPEPSTRRYLRWLQSSPGWLFDYRFLLIRTCPHPGVEVIGDTEIWTVLRTRVLATRLIEKEREVSCRHPPIFVAKRKA